MKTLVGNKCCDNEAVVFKITLPPLPPPLKSLLPLRPQTPHPMGRHPEHHTPRTNLLETTP
jgi:hypothetical protein